METNINKNLKSTGNNLPFKVPENYFENFAMEMESRIHLKPVSIKKLIAPWMYMAAMFVGLFLVTNVFYNMYQQRKANEAEMYELYVLSQMDQSIVIDYYYNETSTSEDK